MSILRCVNNLKLFKRGWKAYLTICNNEHFVWESFNLNHRHNPDEENNYLELQIISNGLKRKVIESIPICECPSCKLLHSYLRENSRNSITMQVVKYIKHNMFQVRTLVRPKLPKNRQEAHDILQTMDIETLYDGKQFLQTNDAEKAVLFFSKVGN